MSKRLEIINTMVSKLKEVTDFGNRVYKKIVMPDLVKEYPAVMVIPGDSVYTPLTTSQYTAGTTFESANGFEVSVIIYAKTEKDIDDAGILTDTIEGLIEKVIQKILSDVTLGLNYVVAVYLDSVSPVLDWKNNLGVAEVTFQVKYDFEKTNP